MPMLVRADACLSAHLYQLCTEFTNKLSAGQKEVARGYGSNSTAIGEEIAQCKERLRRAGAPEATQLESCISNSGGATFLPNREFYEEHLRRLAWRRISLLQVGVFRGESLAVWSEWMRRARIVGLDVNLGPAEAHRSNLEARGAFANKNVELIETDTTDASRFAKTVAAHKELFTAGAFDVIIDDGCHTTPCVLATFDALIGFLKPGGLYFVEDNLEACEKIRGKQLWASASFKGERISDAFDTPSARHPTYLCAFKNPWTSIREGRQHVTNP